ncbi:copper homeostasis protein cutC homolog [Bombus fervidus]|uniref:copper homeostasis protein cutC homolog n=1 Tax=Bombus fervidus TaxID=203811 RepID=UPI003AB4FAF9
MEICIDSIESAKNAIGGGATRLEVCSALSEGGLTPTPGFLRLLKIISPLPLYAMLRTRSGNFIYTKEEMDVMLLDLKLLKEHGANGFVFGALTPDNEIDVKSCQDVLSAARPLPVTFHRAFDEVNDPLKSLQILINLGFKRVLTSGQKDTAEEGLELIQKLVQEAQNRIIVMPGSGITKDNILKIKMASRAEEFHASARKMITLTNRVKIGANKETCIMVTDKEMVEEMVRTIAGVFSI